MKTKTILSIGQMVFVGNKDKREIKGEITAVCIRESTVKYEVTWWKDDSRKSIGRNVDSYAGELME